jgi:two-component system, LuxR family, sensor kinase FixL
VMIDKVHIQQVMLNLIRNAVEAMQTSIVQEIIISATSAPDGMVEICVADTGPGLPSGVREKLFQPYVTTKVAGMGVGLSICKTIVEAHGGLIWATDRIGGGTEFHYTLPKVQTQVAA